MDPIEKIGIGCLLFAILLGVVSARPSVDLLEDIGGAVVIAMIGLAGLVLLIGSEAVGSSQD